MLKLENLKDKKGGSKATAFIIIGGNKMNEIKSLSIDLETYSDVDLSKCGVYKYTESDNFEILLFAYSINHGEVEVVDLAQGEKLPIEIIKALVDDGITKWAYNANFERVCLSRYI